jgi:hypothetical protein
MKILWERGLIDKYYLDRYTMNGWQDAIGVLIPETSLVYLMGSCKDFEKEESIYRQMVMKWEFLLTKCQRATVSWLVKG